VQGDEPALFCIGGPEVTPHIVLQQILEPGETRAVRPSLVKGRYRVRARGMPGGQLVTAAPGGREELAVTISGSGWQDDEVGVALTPQVTLRNATEKPQVVLMERLAWSDQATTGAEVIMLQRFRDLFSRDVLRPGQQTSVGNLTVVFTDLRGSTRMYREVGDAPAFGRVMAHFDILRAAIAQEDGTVVKTIGDAVMAAFARPEDGLAAAVEIQRQVAAFNRAHPLPGGGSEEAVVIKLGLHQGPCIVVTFNDRLDYFGSTVNLAARLQGQSRGGDIVLSPAVADDPAVTPLLERLAAAGVSSRLDQAALKGFDRPLPFQRLDFPAN
jgi:class 3 adenylate cyclase